MRQLREPEAVAEAAVVTDREFLGEDQVEQVEVAHLRLVGPLDVVAQGFGKVRQPEAGGGGAGCGCLVSSLNGRP